MIQQNRGSGLFFEEVFVRELFANGSESTNPGRADRIKEGLKMSFEIVRNLFSKIKFSLLPFPEPKSRK